MIKLRKEHYDRKTKMETMLDYYDCPICMEMKEEFLECPSCSSRACLTCLDGFSRAEHTKNPASKAQNFFKCMICHKFLQQKPMNKFL